MQCGFPDKYIATFNFYTFVYIVIFYMENSYLGILAAGDLTGELPNR